jgi:putative endonuclease
MKTKSYYVYILASKRNGTLYIGVTNDLVRRVFEHKNDFIEGFTRQYGVHTLVYFEETGDAMAAIEREKQLKNWRRKWKMALIEKANPDWKDLWDEIT